MNVRIVSWYRLIAIVALAASGQMIPVAHGVDGELQEIIVTARRSEIALRDAAIAVSVVSGEQIDHSNIGRLDNLNGYVPGLVVAKNDGAGRIVTIRGIGWETTQNLSTQPGVLSYVDGAYLANPLSMGLDLGEIERVEVFRGPQGTEFGQGATGGAINIVTVKPLLDEYAAELELGFGTFDTLRARASANIPLGSKAALRASFQEYQRDGFAEIVGGELHGYQLDDADSSTARLALRIEPRDDWRIDLQGTLQNSAQHAAAQKNIDDPVADVRRLTQDYPGIFELDNASVTLRVGWAAKNNWSLQSLTSWQQLEKRQSMDGDRLTEATLSIDRLGFFVADNWDVLTFWDNDSDAFSQELSLHYETDGVSWVLGAYFLRHDNFTDFLEATSAAPFSDSIDVLENPNPESLPPFASVLNFNETRTVEREDVAIYSRVTVPIADRLDLTAGLRYQREDQRDFGEQFFGLFGGFDRQTNASKTTWKVGIDFQASDNQLFYGLISTGWKNGGTNPGAISNNALFLGQEFAAEEVIAFEMGSRSVLASGRLNVNLTAFVYDHQHMQFVFEDPVPFAGGTGTIPESREFGIESEFRLRLSDGWQLTGALAYQDGEILSDVFVLDAIDFREALAPGIGLFTDAGFAARLALLQSTNLKGNAPAKMPDVTARIALSNSMRLAGGTLDSGIEWLHRGDMQARVFNHREFDRIDAYDVINFHSAYEFSQIEMSVALTVSNLFDEDGVNNTFNNPFGVWSTSNEYIPPREVLVSASMRWN